MKISFEDLEFHLLDKSHDLSSFECVNKELNAFLQEDALENQYAMVSVTRLVYYEGNLIGFFTLVNDCIHKRELQQGDGEKGYRYSHYPALKIARFATHKVYVNRDIGRSMLLKTFAIVMRLSRYVGCRFITIDSKPEAVSYYKKFAFQDALTDNKGGDTTPLYRDFHKTLLEMESE